MEPNRLYSSKVRTTDRPPVPPPPDGLGQWERDARSVAVEAAARLIASPSIVAPIPSPGVGRMVTDLAEILARYILTGARPDIDQ